MWERYNVAGQQAMSQGRAGEAEGHFKLALQEAEKLGPMDAKVATSLNNLANCLRQQSKYPEAEPLYQRALDIKKKTVGLLHPDLVIILDNYAKLMRASGREAEACKLEAQAQAIFSKQ
jgi:tetratricopeptide (TPR) repeat protein